MIGSHWSANAAVLAVVAVLAAVHLRGTAALARDARAAGQPPAGSGLQTAAFYAGLLAVLLALVSPIGYWSLRFVWVRSIQDVLLANVAPACIVLGAPWLALVSGARGRGAGFRLTAQAQAQDQPAQAAGWARLPVLAVVAFNVIWCGWHVPVLYDAALRHEIVYAAQVVSYVGFGVVLWLQLIGSRPLSPALSPLRRVVLLTGTVIVGTFLGMVLVFGYGLAYPGYLGAEHRVLPVVFDQQAGGAVLWVLVLPAYVTAGIALLIRWLNDEESQALTAGFDRLLKPAKPAWPTRTGP